MLSKFKKLDSCNRYCYSKAKFAKNFDNNSEVYSNILILLRLEKSRLDSLKSKRIEINSIIQNNFGAVYICRNFNTEKVFNKKDYFANKAQLQDNNIDLVSNYLLRDFISLCNEHKITMPKSYETVSNSLKGYLDILNNIVNCKIDKSDEYTLKYVTYIKYYFINFIVNKYNIYTKYIEEYIKNSKESNENILDSVIKYLYIIPYYDQYIIDDKHIDINNVQEVLTSYNIYTMFLLFKTCRYYDNTVEEFDNSKIHGYYKCYHLYNYDYKHLIYAMLQEKNILHIKNYYILKKIMANCNLNELTCTLFGKNINFKDNLNKGCFFNTIDKNLLTRYLKLYLSSLL